MYAYKILPSALYIHSAYKFYEGRVYLFEGQGVFRSFSRKSPLFFSDLLEFPSVAVWIKNLFKTCQIYREAVQWMCWNEGKINLAIFSLGDMVDFVLKFFKKNLCLEGICSTITLIFVLQGCASYWIWILCLIGLRSP